MQIQPLTNRIVVKIKAIEQPMSSVLVIPDAVKEAPTSGVVVAAGPGKYVKDVLRPMTVKVGDMVLFPRGTGNQTVLDRQNYVIMAEDDILGIVS